MIPATPVYPSISLLHETVWASPSVVAGAKPAFVILTENHYNPQAKVGNGLAIDRLRDAGSIVFVEGLPRGETLSFHKQTAFVSQPIPLWGWEPDDRLVTRASDAESVKKETIAILRRESTVKSICERNVSMREVIGQAYREDKIQFLVTGRMHVVPADNQPDEVNASALELRTQLADKRIVILNPKTVRTDAEIKAMCRESPRLEENLPDFCRFISDSCLSMFYRLSPQKLSGNLLEMSGQFLSLYSEMTLLSHPYGEVISPDVLQQETIALYTKNIPAIAKELVGLYVANMAQMSPAHMARMKYLKQKTPPAFVEALLSPGLNDPDEPAVPEGNTNAPSWIMDHWNTPQSFYKGFFWTGEGVLMDRAFQESGAVLAQKPACYEAAVQPFLEWVENRAVTLLTPSQPAASEQSSAACSFGDLLEEEGDSPAISVQQDVHKSLPLLQDAVIHAMKVKAHEPPQADEVKEP